MLTDPPFYKLLLVVLVWLCVVLHVVWPAEPARAHRTSPQVEVDLIVHVLGCLAEGLGIRGTARVFEIDPHTMLRWLVEAAEHLHAFSRHLLCALHVKQVQLDELYAVLSAVKAGEMSEEEAIRRLSRSPHWV